MKCGKRTLLDLFIFYVVRKSLIIYKLLFVFIKHVFLNAISPFSVIWFYFEQFMRMFIGNYTFFENLV